MDAKLRQYLLGVAVSLLILAGGCTMNHLYADVEKLKEKSHESETTTAVIQKDIEDFKKDFEDFAKEVKDENARHHQRDRP